MSDSLCLRIGLDQRLVREPVIAMKMRDDDLLDRTRRVLLDRPPLLFVLRVGRPRVDEHRALARIDQEERPLAFDLEDEVVDRLDRDLETLEIVDAHLDVGLDLLRGGAQRAEQREVKTDEDVTTIVLGDKQIFGNSVITLLCEPETYDLR